MGFENKMRYFVFPSHLTTSKRFLRLLFRHILKILKERHWLKPPVFPEAHFLIPRFKHCRQQFQMFIYLYQEFALNQDKFCCSTNDFSVSDHFCGRRGVVFRINKFSNNASVCVYCALATSVETDCIRLPQRHRGYRLPWYVCCSVYQWTILVFHAVSSEMVCLCYAVHIGEFLCKCFMLNDVWLVD